MTKIGEAGQCQDGTADGHAVRVEGAGKTVLIATEERAKTELQQNADDNENRRQDHCGLTEVYRRPMASNADGRDQHEPHDQ